MISRIAFKLFLSSMALAALLYVIFHIKPSEALHVSPDSRPVALQDYGRLPLAFETNIGQTDAAVKYISRGNAYTMFLTGTEAVLALRARDQEAENKNQKAHICPAQRRVSSPTTTSVLRLKLVGAHSGATVTGLEELPGKTNYFIGNDPKKWRTDVPNFAKVKYEQVYPGIDLVYYGNQRQLEYDFVVAPSADPSAIRFAVQNGVSKNHKQKTRIDANGDLVLASDGGDVRMHKPVVYQPGPSSLSHPSAIESRQPVEGRYILAANNQVTLQLGAYDRTRPLIIDPVVSYATYLGGSGSDLGIGIATDASGNAYVVGQTGSTNFPVSTGAYDKSCGTDGNCTGGSDAFLTKLSADGSAIVYSTYLGGSGNDNGFAVTVDSGGNAYITGSTSSTDFPTTANAFQKILASSVSNAFVAKLSASGNSLQYSTYLGGNGSYFGDAGTALAIDSSGAAYVTGSTDSSNFPTKNAFQSSFGGGQQCVVSCDWFSGLCTYTSCPDVFVTKLSANGSSLVYATYVGKTGREYGYGITVDSAGNAYVGGYTNSSDFPTQNAYQLNIGGGDDGFVLKLNPAGSALVFSTFLGGSGTEYLESLTIDSAANVYVTGATQSTNFPTVGAFQASNAGGWDAFITKINAAGNSLAFSTYLGGTGDDIALGIALDASKDVYIVGETTSADFPTVTPTQAALGGGADAFVAHIPATGAAPVFSTYMGGSGNEADQSGAVAVDATGNILVTGNTGSADLPTVGAVQSVYGGGVDAFVAKFSPVSAPGVSLSPTSLDFGNQTTNVTSGARTSTLTNSGTKALTISSITLGTGTNYAQTNNCPISPATLAGGGANCTISVTFTPKTNGTLTDEVEITSDAHGSPHKIALTGIGVAPAPVAELSPASLFFPDQLVNTKGTAQTITLTNTGSAALTISAIAIQPADFTESNDCPISPSKLAISDHCTITVNFDPGTRGSLPGSITITDNAADSPQSVSLSGKGVIAHVVQLSTNTLDFGSQLVGSTSTSQTVTLTNGGDQDLTISSIAATGDFSYTTTCAIPATISGGNNCPITVKFAATATGTRDSTLTITHNAAGSPSTITLKGKGADLTVAAASGGSTSATITAGATATYNLQISPTGYSGNASLACAFSGAQPRGTACTILPASVTLNGADPAPFTVSVSTTARSASSIVSPTPPTSQPFRYIFAAAFLLLLLICSTVTWRERNSCTLGTPVWHWAPLAAFLLVALLSTVSGCGSSPPPPTGTPAGNYNLTLTATASGVSKTSTLTLTVN